MLRPVTVKDVIPTAMGYFDLHEACAADGLLEVVEAVFCVFYCEGGFGVAHSRRVVAVVGGGCVWGLL